MTVELVVILVAVLILVVVTWHMEDRDAAMREDFETHGRKRIGIDFEDWGPPHDR